MRITSMGDSAALIYFDKEDDALNFAEALREEKVPWIVDIVQSYSSVAVFFNLDVTNYDKLVSYLMQAGLHSSSPKPFKTHTIPVCYGLGLDFPRVSSYTGLSREEIIGLHTETIFTVYAIGFCPGFPFMGYLKEPLSKVPRLLSPRLRLEPGSVGITGKQTGIYTEARPGGWNIIGQTPFLMVDVKRDYFPIRTGDKVKFKPMTKESFDFWKGRRFTKELIRT